MGSENTIGARNRYFSIWILSALAFLVIGCGGGGGAQTGVGSAGQTSQTSPQTGTIVLRQTLLRAVPTVVTQERFTGFDIQGSRLYGPITFPKAAEIVLTDVPIAVTQLQIEYLVDNKVVGLATVPVTVTTNTPTSVVDPPFQDVEVVLSSIQVTPVTATVAKGTSKQFTATGTFTDSTQRDLTTSVTWQVDQAGIATISPAGQALGVSPGNAQVRASLGSITGTSALTVTPAVITSIVVTPPNSSVPNGLTQQLTATAVLSDGTTQDVTATADWTSDDTALVSVDSTGKATAVSPGQATVAAAVGGVQGTATVQVTDAVVDSLLVAPANPSLAAGTSLQFTATANLSDGNTRDVTGEATWSSSVPATANISVSGLSGGLEPGETTITAELGGKSAQTALTVTPAVIKSIAVTPSEPSIAKGTNLQLTATGHFSDGSVQDVTSRASWTSEFPDKASVDTVGLVTGEAAGQSTITASLNGVDGSVSFQVTPAVVVSVSVSPLDPSVVVGAMQQFTATAHFSDSTTQDVTGTASWTSEFPGIATVAPGGLATGVAQGQSTIGASSGGKTGTVLLTVNQVPPPAGEAGKDWNLVQGGNLEGVTYGNGRFVAVGSEIKSSIDGVNWTVYSPGPAHALHGVLFQNGQFVAVGDAGCVQTSSDGASWVTQSSGTTYDLRGLAYGNGTFVAVGPYGVIVSSTDGVNWTVQNSGTTFDLQSVAFGNGQFLVVGNEGLVLSSTDGTNWSTLPTSQMGFPDSVVYGNGLFVAAQGGFIYTSPDGNTWTRQTTGINKAISHVVFLDGQFFGEGTGGAIIESSDGINWTSKTSGTKINLAGIAHGNGQYVAVGEIGVILNSPDATTWTTIEEGLDQVLASVGFGNGKIVVTSLSGNRMLVSDDGVTWSLYSSNTPDSLRGVTFGNGKFVAVGPAGSIVTSSDGISWNPQTSGVTTYFSDVTFAGGLFVAVGSSGGIVTSSDGVAWTKQISGTTVTLNCVTFGNGQFVAANQGVVLTSPDGSNWTMHSSGVTQYLGGAAYGSGTYVVVGDGGTIITSSDAVTWVAQTSGITSNLLDVTFGDGQFVAVSAEGAIVTSSDGVNWVRQNSGTAGWLNSVGFNNGQFVAVGLPGLILISP